MLCNYQIFFFYLVSSTVIFSQNYIGFNVLMVLYYIYSELCFLFAEVMKKDEFGKYNTNALQKSLEDISDDPINSFGEPGKSVAKLAEEILQKKENEAFASYNEHLSSQFYHIVNFDGKKSTDKENMFNKFIKV